MKESFWYLQGLLRDNSPWVVPISKNSFSIGRNGNRDLILPSGRVSRDHACLSVQENELVIEDLDSKNGTFLNGTRINTRTVARNNDILRIGEYEFTVRRGIPDKDLERTVLDSKKGGKDDFSRRYGLSEREEEVLYLLLRGKRVQEIGEKLFISPGTAKLHTQNIYKKTGCHSRMELVTLYRGPVKPLL